MKWNEISIAGQENVNPLVTVPLYLVSMAKIFDFKKAIIKKFAMSVAPMSR